jgi:ABC-type bacteriocin/lantibiotic exporter with double-glycine peptidase domain
VNIGWGRRLIIPEVVQTSAMDCGPAALKCLLEGFGIPVSYGRLREACQTDVDGTSIDTLEEVAVRLGLDAEQVMVPPDFVLSEDAGALPSIAVAALPDRRTHFVVAWRRHGGLVQLMDPGTGRRWPSCDQFLSSLHVHTQLVEVSVWRDWATSESFLQPLQRKLTGLGLLHADAIRLLATAVADSRWHSLAALEASARTVESIVGCGGLHRGVETARIVERLYERALSEAGKSAAVIPSQHWSLRPGPPGAGGQERIFFRGAVLVRAKGRLRPADISMVGQNPTDTRLTPRLTVALNEPPPRPGRALLQFLEKDGARAPVVIGALLLAAIGVMVEAVLYRSFLDLADELDLAGSGLLAVGAFMFLGAALLGLELGTTACLLGVGRRLECRLRMAFLKKIPRLGDRYFHSRLNSDMAERSHGLHRIRILPHLGGSLFRSTFELILTTAGIILLDPGSAPLAIVTALAAVTLPVVVQPMLYERDMAVQNHGASLSRYYLDALLGLVPLRTHRAERALRREHADSLRTWRRASFRLQRLVVSWQGLQSLICFGLACWLVADHVARVRELGSVLLLVYWALNLPFLGQETAQVAWQYPAYRNLTVRLLELLEAPEDAEVEPPPSNCVESEGTSVTANTAGASIHLDNVSVQLSGHSVLKDIRVAMPAGSHLAIVGSSGAGKSSLVGTLLGWHRPASGRVLVDGMRLDGNHLQQIRQATAWLDPAVQIWNRSLLENLRYGSADCLSTWATLEAAELHELLQKLPDGLQTVLGESGALVSGGEGQRIRLARALLRANVRLVILDEPFRGLDRQQRRVLLDRCRQHWRDATLLCVTHDLGETLSFPRVLVMEEGRVVEDGAPKDLARQANSHYRNMLLAEEDVLENMWSSAIWQHLRLDRGQLTRSEQAVPV